MGSALRILSEFVADLQGENIPEQVMTDASQRVMDNISAALAAAGNPLVHSILESYRQANGSAASASVWGHSGKYPLTTAVFINTLMCHALELDDVHAKSKSHIGTTVIPAAWAMGEWLNASGRDMLTAVVAGYEVESRIAMSFGVKEHRKQGWHVTSTAGVFGAAAACGKLLGFDTDTMVYCLGLAGAQSFGNWAFLSGDCNCKALNPARASVCGCEAALLAKAGMRGPEHILTAADGGLYAAMTSRAYPEYLTAGLGQVWEIANVDSKLYPCCRSTHCAIDGIIELARREHIRPDDVSAIRIDTYLIGKQQCATSESSLHPSNSAEAKFSMPYCVAAALKKGNVSLESFGPEDISDPDTLALMEKVEVNADEEFTRAYPEHWGCRVTVESQEGTVHQVVVPDASGSIYCPLSEQQARGKARLLTERVFPHDADRLINALADIGHAKSIPALN